MRLVRGVPRRPLQLVERGAHPSRHGAAGAAEDPSETPRVGGHEGVLEPGPEAGGMLVMQSTTAMTLTRTDTTLLHLGGKPWGKWWEKEGSVSGRVLAGVGVMLTMLAVYARGTLGARRGSECAVMVLLVVVLLEVVGADGWVVVLLEVVGAEWWVVVLLEVVGVEGWVVVLLVIDGAEGWVVVLLFVVGVKGGTCYTFGSTELEGGS